MSNMIKQLASVIFLLIGMPAMAQTVTIGTTNFPLGEDAFPNASECLDTTGCSSGDNILVDNLDPLKRAVSPARALLGHRLDLVALDLDAPDAIRLLFPVPIVNQAGPDVYIGQVLFRGALDGLGDAQGINDVGVRIGASPTWHPFTVDEFTGDLDFVGPAYVTYQDPELKQSSYGLQDRPPPLPPLAGFWFITLDLSDFGFSEGDQVQEITIRGSTNLAGSGLDAAIVGNLNSSQAPGPGSVAVPAVTGLAQAAAEAAIVTAGLTVGTVSTASSDTVPAGSVISQTPTAGTEVAAGAAVDLVVSSGPAPLVAPDVVGLNWFAAATAIVAADLTVGPASPAFSAIQPAFRPITSTTMTRE